MWLKTYDGRLVNLDNLTKIYIGNRRELRSDESWPTVYAQTDRNSVHAILFKSDFDPEKEGMWKKGKEECQLYIDTLFRLIPRRASTLAIGHKEIVYLMEEQIKAGKHPNLSTPEEVADAA
tara:strand:- start:84 stop:446 length:363 start_codon:yes stop_codon:yes gene_type:complete